jgi:hypothetical protein
MSRRLNAHPLVLTLLAVAMTTGIGYSAGFTKEIEGTSELPSRAPGADLVDAVVIELNMESVELHIPPDSPVWTGAPTLCYAAVGVLSMIGAPGPPSCNIGYQPPDVESTSVTLYLTDQDVRIDFAGQSMIGKVAIGGSFDSLRVLDRSTGRSMPWLMSGPGGPSFSTMAGSTEFANLIAPMGGIRSLSTGPTLQTTGDSFVGHSVSGHKYEYSVSGDLALPDGSQSGVAIRVEGMARYADSGPYLSDGRVITVIDNLSPLLLFQLLEAPAALSGLRSIGGLVRVDEVITIYAYKGTVFSDGIVGTAWELLRGQVHTEITDARLEQVPASTFGAAQQTETCDCSCAGLAAFERFGEMSNEEMQNDPSAMVVLACGRQCVNQWALRCHQ